MRIKQLTAIAICFFLLSLLSSWITAPGGAAIPGIFRTSEGMGADYATWNAGRIEDVLSGGDQYKVAHYSTDETKPFVYTFPEFRLGAAGLPVSAQNATGGLKYGKYGCTASKYRGGAYEYIPRGYFTISKEGKYTYYGFKKPSSGTFTVDAKGNLLFKGGYFNGGKAEKIDRPNKFFLVFPANPDHRWTCSLVDSQ